MYIIAHPPVRIIIKWNRLPFSPKYRCSATCQVFQSMTTIGERTTCKHEKAISLSFARAVGKGCPLPSVSLSSPGHEGSVKPPGQ